MTQTEAATFTRTASALVAHNDRRAWMRGLSRTLRRAARRSVVAWFGVSVAAVVVYTVPPYPRFY